MWREIPQGSKSLLHQKGGSSRGSRRDQSGRLRNITRLALPPAGLAHARIAATDGG